jgi:hypothetical protein
MRIFAIIIILSLIPCLHARIGETKFEIKERYGEAFRVISKEGSEETWQFHDGSWTIEASFYLDHCHHMFYRKSIMSGDDRHAILKANAPSGTTWKKTDADPLYTPEKQIIMLRSESYRRTDGKGYAWAQISGGGQIHVYTNKWLKLKGKKAEPTIPTERPNF